MMVLTQMKTITPSGAVAVAIAAVLVDHVENVRSGEVSGGAQLNECQCMFACRFPVCPAVGTHYLESVPVI